MAVDKLLGVSSGESTIQRPCYWMVDVTDVSECFETQHGLVQALADFFVQSTGLLFGII